MNQIKKKKQILQMEYPKNSRARVNLSFFGNIVAFDFNYSFLKNVHFTSAFINILLATLTRIPLMRNTTCKRTHDTMCKLYFMRSHYLNLLFISHSDTGNLKQLTIF